MPSGNRTRIEQTAKTRTTTRIGQQQILEADILKLSSDELLQKIDIELEKNVALEQGEDYEEHEEENVEYDTPTGQDDVSIPNDSELGTDYGSEEVPTYPSGHSENDKQEITIGDTKSFVDELKAQIADSDIKDEKQRELVEYLIASLNDNGFIDQSLNDISENLILHHNINASVEDLEEALKILQSFDPPGIGARNLQECLLIQIRRKKEESEKSKKLSKMHVLSLAEEVVERHFELFKRGDLQKVMELMEISADDMQDAMKAISRLNPRPGLSLSEGAAGGNQAIQPDFIVETTIDGDVTFSLRNDDIPPLRVSKEYKQRLNEVQGNELKFYREYVERAQGFIDAIKKRHETLRKIMKAIIKAQKQFFITLDDSDLKPLTQEEIANMANVDGSTVSRAVSGRYAMVDGITFPLKSFFMRTKRNARGEDVVHTKVEAAIREIIQSEDKQNPLSDDKISEKLGQKGLNLSRRTVSKYRVQMGFPVAQMRKQDKFIKKGQ